MVALPTTVSAAHPALTSIFEARIYDDGEYVLPYRIYVPDDYDSNKSYPLLMFFHGAGERGNDNAAQLKIGLGQMFNDSNSPIYQCIVVAPQCPANRQWVNVPAWTETQYSTDAIDESRELKTALRIMEKIKDEYTVDDDRVYVSGISMGGYATWDLLVRHTDLFAAAIPVCGGADYRYAERLVDVPIYTFHGLRDNTVPFHGTERMVNDIREAGGEKITYVTYPDMEHAIWETAYATEELSAWLLSHRLSDRKEQLPPADSDESESITNIEENTTTEDPTSFEETTIPDTSTSSEETTEAETASPGVSPSSHTWILPIAICAGITAAIAGICAWLVRKKKRP